jgi:hypothetical protein
MGLSMRKTVAVLKALCGLSVSAGGLAQGFQRVAKHLQPEYDQLIAKLKSGAVIHADETSWWMGGQSASLWVLCSKQYTFYRVVASRSRATFYETIPADWTGVLVSDCLSVYDEATPVQQKCYAHHLKAIHNAVQVGASDAPGSFLFKCRHLLHSAMALKAEQNALPLEAFVEKRKSLDLAAGVLLDLPQIDDASSERVRLRLRKQIDHLFTFLDHPEVDATNNLAERQLRPAVIARKLSAGNKTRAGANAWQILASLAATCRQQGSCFIEFIASCMSFSAG